MMATAGNHLAELARNEAGGGSGGQGGGPRSAPVTMPGPQSGINRGVITPCGGSEEGGPLREVR